MKRRATETREASGRIAAEVRAPLNIGVATAMPSKKACLQTISRLRKGDLGWKIPNKLSELEIPEKLKHLPDGTKFMLYDSGNIS